MILDSSQAQNSEKAYNYAVYLLSLKLRTEGELREKMRLKKYNAKAVEVVIKRLAENKYLDDQRYAEVYLDNLKKYKNFGYYGIKKKLLEKSLPTGIIESVLGAALPVEEELKLAERFLKKEKFAPNKKPSEDGATYRTFNEDSSQQNQKIANKLKSRGFRGEVIGKLLF
jgi:regulatory protein